MYWRSSSTAVRSPGVGIFVFWLAFVAYAVFLVAMGLVLRAAVRAGDAGGDSDQLLKANFIDS